MIIVICPKCGTENQPKFKFCVKCGSNLSDPSQVNIEQVDMGGYRSEDDSQNNFRIGSGTFTIRDRAPAENHGMFTADELNDTDEDFDFSNIDEPFIPKLDAERIKVPTASRQPAQKQPQPQMQPQPQTMGGMGMNPVNMPQGGMQAQPMNGMGMGQMGMQAQPVGNMGMNPMGMPQNGMQAQPMNGMGMNPMGMAGYGQPVMSQPQIIGYDQNGMPVYSQAQPMMYAQPVVIGYDQNGMPIYGQAQPMMYAQPVIIGYDQNGMPVYGQAQPMMYAQPMMNEGGEQVQPQFAAPPMMGMPQQVQGMPNPAAYGAVPPQPVQPQSQPQTPPQETGQVKMPNKFWNNFFSEDGDDSQDEFFGSEQGKEMGSVSAKGLDRLKKPEHKKRDYMSATPDVDASELKPNDSDKINKLYMRKADSVRGNDLGEKQQTFKRPVMNETAEVDASGLEYNEQKKSRITMTQAGEANPEELEAYNPEHKEAIMAQADHAVEAMPKKKKIVDELDAIELPAYMQARKTVPEAETAEIPELPNS